MTNQEFMTWAAYYRVEPWGDDRADIRSAIVAQVTASLSNLVAKRPRSFKLSQFIPKFNRPTKQTPAQIETAIKAAFPGHG